MFDRFTEQSREAVALAQEEARRLGHPWFGTEHLLLGVLHQRETRARQVLSNLGVTPALVERRLVEEIGEPRRDRILGNEDEEALGSLGIDLKEVRRRVEETFGPGALKRARPGRCGLPDVAQGGPINTDHLLLGMVQVRGALAMRRLRSLGVRADAVRDAVETQRRRAS